MTRKAKVIRNSFSNMLKKGGASFRYLHLVPVVSGPKKISVRLY